MTIKITYSKVGKEDETFNNIYGYMVSDNTFTMKTILNEEIKVNRKDIKEIKVIREIVEKAYRTKAGRELRYELLR